MVRRGGNREAGEGGVRDTATEISAAFLNKQSTLLLSDRKKSKKQEISILHLGNPFYDVSIMYVRVSQKDFFAAAMSLPGKGAVSDLTKSLFLMKARQGGLIIILEELT